MFRLLGQLASRRSKALTAIWLLIVVASFVFTPEWKSVVENGEFAFLPADSASVEADRIFRQTFPEHSASSNIVLVVRRVTSAKNGLLDQDQLFVTTTLLPMLRRVADFPEGENEPNEDTEEGRNSIIRKISSRDTRNIGPLFDSEDGQASLVVMELRSEFMDEANEELISKIEDELVELRTIPDSDPDRVAVPQGLDITFSGTAIYGRDAIKESRASAKATETWTVILVIVLLLMMYRAPLLAMIPLITVSVSGAITLNLLAIAAQWGWVHLFNGIEAYVTVLVYGAGIDYCLFLIARYREELLGGATIEEAIQTTLNRVGSALAASAGTTMCGIGMMYFADFGKFQQAGIAISFGLLICLLASLTLAPAVIRLFGRWAFWPRIPARESTATTLVSRPDVLTRLLSRPIFRIGWDRVGAILLRRPKFMWLCSIVGMLPFSIAGLVCFGFLSYGLLSDLPIDAPSVRGARALQEHFPGGEGVPVRVIVKNPGTNYSKRTPRPPEGIVKFADAILEHKDEFGIKSVRSLADPKGGRDIGKVINAAERLRATQMFASSEEESTTRLDIIFRNNPFSKTSIDEFRRLRNRLPEFLPESMKDAEIVIAGETANLSDLKEVTDSDRLRINILVTFVVFVILWILLRKPFICLYLMVTVLFSYFATLGCTFLVFWATCDDPSGFAGLDWKVPMFLFTILIAVGEDYNIFLLTRIEEERPEHGDINSIPVALKHTGGIISSCGIIMAGTFSSLMAGSLAGMDQLGFALALGVILDTFVVRPIMVPAFLIMLARRRQKQTSQAETAVI